MLYIPKIGDYLKMTDDEVKDFVFINFSKYLIQKNGCILK